jgi:DNA replication protein DnaC
MSKAVFSKINIEYEKRRQQSFDHLIERQNEVYSKIPRILEIDNEIKLIGVKYNKKILFGNKSSAILDELLTKISLLKLEKESLLLEAGYSKNFLEQEFTCQLCNDTGYIQGIEGTQRCSCLKQQLIFHIYKNSNLKLTETENFSAFDESLYPDSVNESKYGLNVSPRDNILNLKNICTQFIENFDSIDQKNLFFSGPTGVGKTFMSNCIASEIIKSGKTVLYQTAPLLFNTINEFKLKAFNEEGYEDTGYRSIFETELLIIDDLGTESQTSSRYAELLNILNTRFMNNLTKPCKTIISTNIGAKQLNDYYTERVMSRIVGSFEMLRFVGLDIRHIKTKNNI